MGKPIHVVILTGGYNSSLPGAAGDGPAVPGLMPLDGVPAVIRLLRALQTARRVALASVWVVHNNSDEAALKGPDGIFAPNPKSDLGLPAINFLSNGASSPGQWRGEAADLAVALRALGAGVAGTGGVAVMSASMALMPHYNMQRLLEHAYLRGRDVVGFSHLSGLDLELLGSQGHTQLQPADDTSLPRVAALVPHTAPAPGDKVVEPFLFLRPESVGGVAGRGGGGSLAEAARELVAAGGYVAGIDIMFGRYNLRTAEAVEYADKFFGFIAAAAIDPYVLGLKPEAVLRPYDTSPGGADKGVLPPPPAAGSFTGRSTAADFRFDLLDGAGDKASGDTDYDAFSRCSAAFNERFFGTGPGASGGKGVTKHYLLPNTFYMTAYRRQAADIML